MNFIWNQALHLNTIFAIVTQYKLINFSELISSSVKEVTTSLTGLFRGLNYVIYVNHPANTYDLRW